MALNGSIEERIAAKLDSLSPKQKRLARFILDSKYYMSFASASQAAEKTGTSAATVVRFAQALDYEGYSEMQSSIRTELPSYLTAVERIQARLASAPTKNDTLQNVFLTDIQNIERTANNLIEVDVDRVVDEILKARRILVVGAGISAAPADFLAHSLKVIGFDTRLYTSGGLPLAVETSQIQPGDLLIAISVWRYVRSTVQALEAARLAGARTIAVTDSIVSPLAKLADDAFEIATDGVAHSLSPTAILSFINVIVAMLSFRAPEKVMESLRRVDGAYQSNNLLTFE